MARVVEGLHSFTCTPTRLSTNGMNHICLCLRAAIGSHLQIPEGWKVTMASKQSAQDRYVAGIAVVSCSNRHASLGKWGAVAMSVEQHEASYYAFLVKPTK